MSYVWTSASATPIAANPAASDMPQCQATGPAPAPVTATLSSRPHAATTSSTSRGAAADATTRSHGRYPAVARAATCPAYAARSWATCAAVCRQLHSSEPARACQSSSTRGLSTAIISAIACSTCWPPTALISTCSQLRTGVAFVTAGRREPRGGANDAVIAKRWRYPVASMQGERIAAVQVPADGLEGDRRWAFPTSTRSRPHVHAGSSDPDHGLGRIAIRSSTCSTQLEERTIVASST